MKNLTKSRNKAKMAFDLLEKEMELIDTTQLSKFTGGTSTGSTGADCVMQAIAFATGLSYDEVKTAYGSWKESSTGIEESAEAFSFIGSNFGMGTEDASAFAMHMGLTNAGDEPVGPYGYSVSGDQSVAYLDNGSGNGHAIVLTGNASASEYYYYDPQTGVMGTISEYDPRIIGTYGY